MRYRQIASAALLTVLFTGCDAVPQLSGPAAGPSTITSITDYDVERANLQLDIDQAQAVYNATDLNNPEARSFKGMLYTLADMYASCPVETEAVVATTGALGVALMGAFVLVGNPEVAVPAWWAMRVALAGFASQQTQAYSRLQACMNSAHP